jgi:putative inorganic carbon (HCO3(-)) transporter
MKLFLGISLIFLPLWGFTFLRIPIGSLSLDPYVLLIIIACFFSIFRANTFRVSVGKIDAFVVMFFISVLLSCLTNSGLESAYAEAARYVFNFSVYVIARVVFNSSRCDFSPAAYLGFTLVSIFVLGYIFYTYIIVKGSFYISISLDEAAGVEGRNRLAMVLLIIGPVLFSYYRFKRNVFDFSYLVSVVGIGIWLVSICLVQSRGAWLSIALAFVTYSVPRLVLRSRANQSPRTWRSKGAIAFSIVAALLSSTAALIYGGEYVERVQSRAMRSFSEEGADASTVTRLGYIEEGLDIYAENPISGGGAGSVLSRFGQVSHNDYIKVMAEFGTLGIITFLLVMISIVVGWIKIVTGPPVPGVGPALLSSAVVLSFYMLFRNILDAPMFWVLVGYSATYISLWNKSAFRRGLAKPVAVAGISKLNLG